MPATSAPGTPRSSTSATSSTRPRRRPARRSTESTANSNGPFKYCYSLNISAITDGTSNTFLYGEKANGLFPASESFCFNWWGDSVSGDTIFTTLYPLNAYKKVPFVHDEYDYSWVEGVSSFHPGGANLAFADGSVHFIKDSIRVGLTTRRPATPSA